MTNSIERDPEEDPTRHSAKEPAPRADPAEQQAPDPSPTPGQKRKYVPFEPFNPFIRRTEATFVPQEPKIYVPPRSDDEEDDKDRVPVETWRLFIAIELPRKLKREFIDLARSFRPREHERVRWIGQEAMHLTLKFLGDTPTDRVSDIITSLERAASSTGKFSIKVGRTGCFPSFRDPRICWVGLSGELRRLEQLQGRVEGGLVALGFEPEDRKFKPHVTVGRTRPGIRGRFAEDIGVSWRHAPLHSTGTTIPISAIALYRSYLGEDAGARYEQLANLELG
ncbi:MAG: RNA 2',3'-cyclic phosphodiesterase [Chloroflexi bacterium]|nr:RNA 2',3'-cyclic phosphodiesterase [Chloroflexota bacterium]